MKGITTVIGSIVTYISIMATCFATLVTKPMILQVVCVVATQEEELEWSPKP